MYSKIQLEKQNQWNLTDCIFLVAAEAALALEGADGYELLLHGEYAAEVEAEGIAEGPAFPVQDIK